MERHYHLHAAERKPLIAAIEKITGTKPTYTGPRQFAYLFGDLTLDKEGTLSSENEVELERIARQLVAEGFRAGEEEPHGLTISLPKDNLSESAIERLKAVIEAKTGIIQKALGASSTEVVVEEETLSFPWFSKLPPTETIQACTTFLSLLVKHAREAKRVTGKEHEVINEKYYFRCFLLRLGMIGAEYKEARHILLQNLEGSSAFRFQPQEKEAAHA